MALRRVSESKSLALVPVGDGKAKLVELPKQQVVEEAPFQCSIQTILDRDFFPELPKLRLYNEWLDAVKEHNHLKMAQIRTKWSLQETDSLPIRPAGVRRPQPDMSSSNLETPSLEYGNDEASWAKRPKLREYENEEVEETCFLVDTPIEEVVSSQLYKDARKMTLDQFMTKYTSEDDASFSKLLEQQSTVARKAYEEAYESASRIQAKMLAEGRLVGWKEYDPKHSSVMSAVASPQLNLDVSRYAEKTIIPENSRFPEDGPSWERKQTNSATSTPLTTSSDGFKVPFPISGNLDAQLYKSILTSGQSAASGGSLIIPIGSASPYSLVSTPLLKAGEVDQSPLITWGEISGGSIFPLSEAGEAVLKNAEISSSSSDATQSGFSVPPISSRLTTTSKILSDKRKSNTTSSKVKAALHAQSIRSPMLASSSGQAPSGRNSALSSPLLTPDLQLRSSYSKSSNRTSSSRAPSATSTPSVASSSSNRTPSIGKSTS